MSATEPYCPQEVRITRLENAVSSIQDQVSRMTAEFMVLKVRIEAALDQVAEHDRVLKGKDGSPGVIAKVANSVELIEDLNDALRGVDGASGLISEIRSLKEQIGDWGDTKKWLTRLVIGWVITAILGLIFLEVK